MSELWVDAEISELRSQIHELESESGLEYELAKKLGRYAGLLREKGEREEAAKVEMRLLKLRNLKSPATLAVKKEPAALPCENEISALEDSPPSVLTFVAALAALVIALRAPAGALSGLFWFWLVQFVVKLGFKVGMRGFKSRKQSSAELNNIVCFGLVLWIIPVLGLFYGAMSLAMSQFVQARQAQNKAISFICLLLSIVNSAAGYLLILSPVLK